MAVPDRSSALGVWSIRTFSDPISPATAHPAETRERSWSEMNQFGTFLCEQGALSRDELKQGLRFQAVYGGRIGTCLLDLGYLVVEELAAYLSDYYNVPLPPPDWMDCPDPKAAAVVPSPLIRQIQVLPLKLEKERLHVAMIDPRNEEHLDFLRMASTREIVPYVLPEKRLVSLLESHLGIDRNPRFIGMIARPRQIGLHEEKAISATPLLRARQRTRTDLDRPIGGEPEVAPPPSAPPTPSAIDDDQAEDIILLEELVAEPADRERWTLPGETSALPTADVPFSAYLAHLEAQLHGCDERDEIIRLGLRLASSFARAAALFVLRRDLVSGFRANTQELTASLAAIEIPIQTPSMLTYPAVNHLAFRGPPPRDGIDGRLIASLGRHDVREVFVHPISIRGRTVNVLYADNGTDAFGETSIAALTALCACLARSYERLLMASRKRN